MKVALAACLITLSAEITVPFWPVPMTMQVAAIFLVASMGVYLTAGAAGLSVFAGTPEKGIGLTYMFGPTGGYLVGFSIAAILVGWATDRFGRRLGCLSMPLGLAVIYAFGVAWLAQFVPTAKVLALGVMPFLFGDACKVALAMFLTAMALTTISRWAQWRY